MSKTHGFWIGVADNRVFDGVVTRHLVEHGDIVVINGFYDSDAYPYSNIVERLHAESPEIRVLLYTWAGRKPLGATHIGAVPTLDKMENLSYLLRDANGELIKISRDGREFIFLDPRFIEARDWLRDQVSCVANLVGSDGVGLDGAIRAPRFLSQVPGGFDEYPPAFDSMIQAISETTPITIFNGLSPRGNQELLLAVAHGAAIEFFGLNDRVNREPTFEEDILRYFDAIAHHPDRAFLVFGRASRRRRPYTTYDEDWLWQRYLYCAYLLTAGPNTRWKHHAGFLASPNGGRAGGLDVYTDALHDLGSALGNYTVEGGCYRRAFERGLVLVVPGEAREPTTVSIDRPMFTLDGAPVSGEVSLAPGEGQVLLRRRPAHPQALIRRFDSGLDPLWRWSVLREESGSYLHLEEALPGEESEHDLALDLVRYRAPRGQVTLWYRTSDPAARVEIVIEVDDKNLKDPVVRFVLVDCSLEIGSEQPPRPAQFRAVAPSISQFLVLPVIGGGAPMDVDGTWHTLVIDLQAACGVSGRYEFHRALFARLLGSMDIRRLRLAA
jgi:Hypothetical glycosyl hydrolase family 15